MDPWFDEQDWSVQQANEMPIVLDPTGTFKPTCVLYWRSADGVTSGKDYRFTFGRVDPCPLGLFPSYTSIRRTRVHYGCKVSTWLCSINPKCCYWSAYIAANLIRIVFELETNDRQLDSFNRGLGF